MEMPAKNLIHLDVYVEPETARRVKVEAARQDIPMYRFMGQVLETALSDEKECATGKRDCPNEAIEHLCMEIRELQAQVRKLQPPDSGDVMTTSEVAKEMRCTAQMVRNYMAEGKLKFFIPPGQTQKKTRRAWVNEFIEKRAASSMEKQ